MRTFRVEWVIELEAHTALGAALEAREYQRDPDTLATIFDVTDIDSGEEEGETIDLLGVD